MWFVVSMQIRTQRIKVQTCTLARPNVRAVQRAVEQRKGQHFARQIILLLGKEVPQDHAHTHQELERGQA